MKFDLSFEQEILAQSLKDPNYLKDASRALDYHHFGTEEYSWCWRTIKDVWSKYKELTTEKLFVVRAKGDFRDEEERIRHLKAAKELFKKKIKAPRATLDELVKFVRLVNAQKGMESAVDKLDNGQIDSAYKEFRKLSKEDFKPTEYTSIEWIEEFENRQRERKNLRDNPELLVRVPTNFKKLDRIIGGIQVGELGLVMATTSQGKSAMLTNLAHAALITKKRLYRVVYFAMEMPARQIAMRHDARWLKMSYNKFKNYDFTREEKRIIQKRLKRAKRVMKGRFRIASFPLGKPTIDSIKRALDDFYEENEFRPDLILLDSPDHMKPVDRQKDIRLNHTTTYQEVKAFGEEEGYAIWASTHAGRDWAKKVATAEASGESYDKSRIADIVLTLNTPERKTRSTKVTLSDDDDDIIDDPSTLAKYRYIEMYLAKNRDGESRISIPLDGNFSKMLFEELEE